MTTFEGERRRGAVNAAIITSATGAESPELSPWNALQGGSARWGASGCTVVLTSTLAPCLPLFPCAKAMEINCHHDMASLTRGFT